MQRAARPRTAGPPPNARQVNARAVVVSVTVVCLEFPPRAARVFHILCIPRSAFLRQSCGRQ
eukprot:416310-Lingulodinium_polyedra.AAC.1